MSRRSCKSNSQFKTCHHAVDTASALRWRFHLLHFSGFPCFLSALLFSLPPSKLRDFAVVPWLVQLQEIYYNFTDKAHVVDDRGSNSTDGSFNRLPQAFRLPIFPPC